MSFVLTDENYYSNEADINFLSCSQYQAFGECEAKAMAKLQGRWIDEPKEAFLVGNYFHSYFESPQAHEKFCKENFEHIFKTKEEVVQKATKTQPKVTRTDVTGKYAPFEKADKMIETVENEELMKRFIDMEGKNELFMTGTIFNVPWRMKMDKYIPDTRFIVDYKTVANIWETSYDPVKGERVSFVESYGYLFRAAVYSLIECQNVYGITFDEAYKKLYEGELKLPDFFLLCVSKQDVPDKEIIRLNHRQAYIGELEKVKNNLIEIMKVKSGVRKQKRCGTCDYCRSTKKLTEIKPYYILKPEFREQREEDYAI